MTAVFQDADIVGGLSAAAAVRWMGEAVDAHHRGELIAPPGHHRVLLGRPRRDRGLPARPPGLRRAAAGYL